MACEFENYGHLVQKNYYQRSWGVSLSIPADGGGGAGELFSWKKLKEFGMQSSFGKARVHEQSFL